MKVMMDLCVVPIGVGVSLSEYIVECQRVLKAAGLKTELHAYGTVIEGEGDDVAFSTGWKENFLKDPVSLGACRPVVVGPLIAASGFTNAERTYSGHGESWPSEIVVARRP